MWGDHGDVAGRQVGEPDDVDELYRHEHVVALSAHPRLEHARP